MQTITRNELKRMNGEESRDFVLINVLPTEAFNKQHIRTSVNIPLDSEDFVSDVQQAAGNKDREVVVYCANKDCDASPQAAKKLEEAGFRNVFDYEGGTADWFSYKEH